MEAKPGETTIWEGGYSGWTLAHGWGACSLLALLGLAGWGLLPGTSDTPGGGDTGGRWSDKTIFLLAFEGLLSLYALYLLGLYLVRKLTLWYRLTNSRLFLSVGFLVRYHHELDLVRVDDVAVRQTLVERLFNVGTVKVFAPTDSTHPTVELIGIRDPLAVKEKIREAVKPLKDKTMRLEQI